MTRLPWIILFVNDHQREETSPCVEVFYNDIKRVCHTHFDHECLGLHDIVFGSFENILIVYMVSSIHESNEKYFHSSRIGYEKPIFHKPTLEFEYCTLEKIPQCIYENDQQDK